MAGAFRCSGGGARLALQGESEHGETPAGASIRPGAITALLAEIARCEPSNALPALTPGTRVDRYEIIRPIGHGGFGSVYEAHDAGLRRLVALKVLRRTRSGDAQSASEEGEAAARLAHPNIAALHDAGVLEGGAPYLVYELLHGETLESRLTRGPIPPREALAIAAQVARALVHAHGAGIVHRDLKPANVFLTVAGDAKVLDFGLALLFGRDGPAGGTPGYLAPEQSRGEPEDARTDLYGLGLLLREMLTGGRCAQADGSPSRIPPAAGRVLAALLAEEPASRPRSAGAALVEIEAAGRAIRVPGARRRWIAAAGLALVTTLAALLLRERPRPGAPAQASVPSIAVLRSSDLSPHHDQEYLEERGTASAEAYRQYLLGRQFASQETIVGLRRAISAFEKAVAADPGYAQAWAGLSNACFWYAESTDAAAERDEYQRRAMNAAEAAVAAGPRLADAYAARGFVRASARFPADWEGAEADLRRALELNPRDAVTLRNLGYFVLAARGRHEEGIAALRRSTESDPLDALGWLALAAAYSETDRTLARAAVERALEIAPDSHLAQHHLASILLLEGRAAEARAVAERMPHELGRAFALALAEHSLGHAGESDRALEELTRGWASTGAYQIAIVHAWRGDREGAFAWLERAYVQRDRGLNDLLRDPMLRSLRGDPRHTALLQKLGLPSQ